MKGQDLIKAIGLTIWGMHNDGYTTSTQILIMQMLVTAPDEAGITVQDLIVATKCGQSSAQKTLTRLCDQGFARKNVSESRYQYFPTEKLKEKFLKYLPIAAREELEMEVAS
jgi:predicted transcriptional regulator